MSTITVNSLADVPTNGVTTLRDAINAANLTSGDTIGFSVTGNIVINSPLPALKSSVTITGSNISIVGKVDRVLTPGQGSFSIGVTGIVTISGISFSGNEYEHLGIENAGTVTFTNCKFLNAMETNMIQNSGTMTIETSTFVGPGGMTFMFNYNILNIDSASFASLQANGGYANMGWPQTVNII